MWKSTPAQVAVDRDFNGERHFAGHIVGGAREKHRGEINENKNGKISQRHAAHEMVECVPLKKRNGHIHRAAPKTAKNH